MAFRRTSEGRVFFKSTEDESKPANGGLTQQASLAPEPSRNDQSQMQILILLKSLNAKLVETQEERTVVKEELAKYKAELKALEEKATRSEKSYIDLEQKFATKQNETFKKASRVEETIKETAKELERARHLVESLEGKSQDNEETLKTIKEDLTQRKKLDEEIQTLQKTLLQQQKEQAENMAENMSALVSLTKRVGESEARQEVLDNKIEEATTEFLKLDRKINKAIEDRTRLLRKIERMEEAVQETREALNAKAMVLLTSQGQMSASELPQIEDGSAPPLPMLENLSADQKPIIKFWNRSFQIDPSAVVMIIVIGLLLGWMISEIKNPGRSAQVNKTEKITWNEPASSESYKTTGIPADMSAEKEPEKNSSTFETAIYTGEETPALPTDEKLEESQETQINTETATADTQTENLDRAIQNGDEKTLMAAFEENPDAVAARLNEIEPSSLVSTDLKEPIQAETLSPTTENKEPATKSLKDRLEPDKNLPAEIRKVEEQAFAGVGEAQHDMGALYIAGHDPVKKDLKRAVFWFEEAAQNGISNAKYNLGVLYHQGMGVNSNLEKALELYSEAAALGHPEAQYNLGIAYIGGIGYPYDPVKAAENFEKAANSGVMEAAYNLGLIYENGLLGKPQPDEALMWYKEAADQGSPEAKTALEQLAQSLGITISEVNRIVDAVKSAKRKAGTDSGVKQSSASAPSKTSANRTATPYPVSTSTLAPKQNLIADIQAELMRRGLYPGPVDGKIGPVTTDAIRTYQSAANMKVVDGQPTQELLNFMKSSGNR